MDKKAVSKSRTCHSHDRCGTLKQIVMNKIFILLLLVLSSCGKVKSDSQTDLNESDFTQAQGLITKIETDFSYSEKFKRTYHYVYGSESELKLYGIEKNSELILNENDPIIVLTNKTDRTKSYISQRGIINKEVLTYLKKQNLIKTDKK